MLPPRSCFWDCNSAGKLALGTQRLGPGATWMDDHTGLDGAMARRLQNMNAHVVRTLPRAQQLISFPKKYSRQPFVSPPPRIEGYRSQYECFCCLPADPDDPDFFDGTEFMWSVATQRPPAGCFGCAVYSSPAASSSGSGLSDRSSVPNTANVEDEQGG